MKYNYNDFMNKCSIVVKEFLLDAFKVFHHLVIKCGDRNNTDTLLKQSLLLSGVVHRSRFINNPFSEKSVELISNYFNINEIKPCTEQEGRLAYQIFSYNLDEIIGDEEITPDKLSLELIIYNILKDNNIRILLKELEINSFASTHYEVILTKAADAYTFRKYLEKENQKKNVALENNPKPKGNINEFGIFLTNKNYNYNPAIGREEELRRLKIDLLKSKSIILIGEAGIGKTAIIEGLAFDLINDNVPNYLKNIKILKVDIHALIAGTKYRGDFEEKAKKLVNVLKNNPDVIAYIEEIHSIKGMGDNASSSFDLMNILKPYLSNGDIKIIGDTTISEYDKFIAQDAAFSRRFIIETIKEPRTDVLKNIVIAKINEFMVRYNIAFDFNEYDKNLILNALINITNSEKQAYYSTRRNPDFVIDVLENIFAIAAYHNRQEITLNDIFEGMQMIEDVSATYKERIIQELKDTLMQSKNFSRSRVLKFPSLIKQ